MHSPERSRAPGRPRVAFRLLAITDRKVVAGGDLAAWLEKLCGSGIRGVMIREKDLAEEDLFRLALACRPALAEHGAEWLINGSARVARRAGATGVHLTGSQDIAAARAAAGEGLVVGKSVHSATEARAAEEAGAEYLLFGPVYDTPSKSPFGPPQGVEKLSVVCASVRIPVFAVGGVDPVRAGACLRGGASGVAVISSLARLPEPAAVMREFERELGSL